ncbi:MAG: 1-acyl-sn-glycerol-3-phosphate acyltransferase [Candidatus Cloacimonetes bacterium]|nr:1-acyl-sn-glycerol-3-phosphate acyltransferase [Candidatus Cloacimonadota bacterium]
MRKRYNIITSTVRLYMKIFWRLEIINRDRLSDISECIIVANHISAFDPPFIGSIIPQEIYYLAKVELFKNKIFGALLKSLNCIPVKRGKVDRNAVTMVMKVLDHGHSILIFPEGTRKSSRVKSGVGKFAIETHKDIYPIYIHNSTNFLKCFLGKERLKIVIGERIKAVTFADLESKRGDHQKLATRIMESVYRLKNEC